MMDVDDDGDDEVDDLHHDRDHYDDDMMCRPVDIDWVTQKGSS